MSEHILIAQCTIEQWLQIRNFQSNVLNAQYFFFWFENGVQQQTNKIKQQQQTKFLFSRVWM